MKLIILRHAEAADLSQTAGSDQERYLTAHGEGQSRLAGQILKRMDLAPRTIWSSPYPRALQTAQIAAEQLAQAVEVKAMALLEPGAAAEEIAERISETPPEEPLMIVGHNPDLEELVGHLISHSDQTWVNLGKGTIAVLDIDLPVSQGCATLKGLWSNKHMNALSND